MGNFTKRSEKIAFYTVGEVLTRMKGFTSLSVSKGAKEYTRTYVDEDFEQSDVVGFSPTISFDFDYDPENAVHVDLAAIADDELMGEAAVKVITIVDMTQKATTEGTYVAYQRSYAVIPDSEGGNTDRYNYSGTLKVKTASVKGVATSTDGWQTCTFVADQD